MTDFCFVGSSILTLPNMEPMVADDLDEARAESEALLSQHASEDAAHGFEVDERIAAITGFWCHRVGPKWSTWATCPA